MGSTAQALQVTHHLDTTIGIFNACAETFTYKFYNDRDYDIKTSVYTKGTFGALYPFKSQYHSIGTFSGSNFKPQSYYQEAKSRFNNRTKEIFYQDGVPQYRISTKNDERVKYECKLNNKYQSSNDLLTTFAKLTHQIMQTGKCNFDGYSYNGKRYSRSTVKTIGTEKLKTPYFSGKAIKCSYKMEILDDASAKFILDGKKPVYFWVMRDEQTDAPFIARILVESTPLGQLESLTTKIEVKK